MKTNTIRNDKTTAILGNNFTYNCMGVTTTLPKGFKVNAREFTVDGYKLVMGHGIAEMIPAALFTKYVRTWDEVNTVNNVTTVVHKTEDVTDIYRDWIKRETERRNAAVLREKKAAARRRIAELRKMIRMVKKGEAEAEINNLLAIL